MEPLTDTDPEAARVQMELLRRASPARRLRLALSLSSGGESPGRDRKEDVVNVIHLETMLKVDVFVSKGRPFDRRSMERARAAAPQNTDECPLPLASAEDTILAKLEWFRRGGEVSERQWTDVLGCCAPEGPRSTVATSRTAHASSR